MNMYGNILLLKLLLLLWVICVVWCEQQKRDLHRIVLKNRSPRSHKKGHRSHSHGHSHSQSHYKSHGHKKVKKPSSSSEQDSSSYEDIRSSSKESIYDGLFHRNKGHQSYYKQKTPLSIPSYPTNLDIEETRLSSYRDVTKPYLQSQWLPLNQDHHLAMLFEHNREQRPKRKDNKNKKQQNQRLKPFSFELTTPFSLQFDPSTVYPPLTFYENSLRNYDLHKKIIDQNNSPLIGAIEQTNLGFPNVNGNLEIIKNQQSRYDVKEVPETITTLISVPDVSQEEKKENENTPSEKQIEETTTEKLPKRSKTYRGRTRY